VVPKIVLDTNVLVAAFGWKGPPHEIFLKCIDGSLQLFISPALMLELNKVLGYGKFKFNEHELKEFLSLVIETANIVDPQTTLNIIKADPPDNRVLECALAAGASCIVTGDKHLLSLIKIEKIKILSPGAFIKVM